MSVVGIIEDLIALERLAAQESDSGRRRSLETVRAHVAGRERGAKVAEAAEILSVSAPTVRAWVAAGVLHVVGGSGPLRVDVMSVAATKQVLDELRRHSDDRHVLADVLRVLRDREAQAGIEARSGVDDLAAGRVRRIDAGSLDELLPSTKVARSSST